MTINFGDKMNKLIVSLICLWINNTLSAQTEQSILKVTDDIQLIKITDNAYVHVSWAELPPYGRFASNGLIFVNGSQAFLLDTPVNDALTMQLTNFLMDSLNLNLAGFVPNHWHDDCMGGLAYLKGIGVESYANQLTIDIARSRNLPLPAHGFTDSLVLTLSDKPIFCYFPGAAHSMDNIVVWIPSEKILFGGCMVRDLNSKNMGNTTDGNVAEWKKTIEKVIHKFSKARYVIPGHGRFGGPELLLHTKKLLAQ